jgi:hypothetical protein
MELALGNVLEDTPLAGENQPESYEERRLAGGAQLRAESYAAPSPIPSTAPFQLPLAGGVPVMVTTTAVVVAVREPSAFSDGCECCKLVAKSRSW